MDKTRALIMIDGPSLFYSSKDLGMTVNYEKLQEFIEERYYPIAFRYYNILPKGEKTPVYSLSHYLTRVGYSVICPEVDFTEREDGSKDFNLSVHDLLEADLKTIFEESSKVETLVLVSHDASFKGFLNRFQLSGIKTVLIGTRKTERPRVSYPLLMSAGTFIDLYSCRFMSFGATHEKEINGEENEKETVEEN